MDNKKDVSIAAFDSALAHSQLANRRLAWLLALSLIINALMFGVLMYFLTGYEISSEQVTIDSHEGTANYIGNDNFGDITNGDD